MITRQMASSKGHRAITAKDLLIVFLVFVFCAGLIWGYMGLSMRKRYHRKWMVAVRKDAALGVVTSEDLLGMKALEASLITAEQSRAGTGRGIADDAAVAGIELTALIQSFLHEYRLLFSEKQITLEDRNFGFSDSIREVAVIADERESRLLAIQLQLMKDYLTLLADAKPLSLVAVTRHVASAQTQGIDGVNQSTGRLETPDLKFQYHIRITFEFYGYTRSLRDFLNAHVAEAVEGHVVELSVNRSELSEEDRSSEWIDGQVEVAHQQGKKASPFAAYLQTRPVEDKGPLVETKPLIGEVISYFQVTLEKGVQF